MDYRIAKHDDDLLDDWEQMADSGLMDKKIQNFRNQTSNNPAMQTPPSHFLFHQDGTVKTAPEGPPPQIKILKRPQNNNGMKHSNSAGDLKPKPPVKTLQQKEAEYAKARLRILGEASPPAQPNDINVAKLQGKFETLRTNEPSSSGLLRLPKGPDGSRGFHQGSTHFI